MTPLPPLVRLAERPPGVAAECHFGSWLAAVAARLLNATELRVGGRPYRFADVEAYYHGAGHPDPFTHRHPLQRTAGRWYFHRTGGAYRGGSFKGLDLTLGDGRAAFGVLVRAVVAPDGAVVDGPSLTVDHLLARTGTAGVAALDGVIAGRPAWDASSPLAVCDAAPRAAAVLATARVGLSLRRPAGPDALRFVTRPYRYLADPRRVSKGKPQIVIALHQQGLGAAAIRAATGVPAAAVRRYVAAYEEGAAAGNPAGFVGKALGSAEWCRLAGACAATFGGGE